MPADRQTDRQTDNSEGFIVTPISNKTKRFHYYAKRNELSRVVQKNIGVVWFYACYE